MKRSPSGLSRSLRGSLSSVRVRLTLWNVLVLALVLVLLGGLLRQRLQDNLTSAIDRDLGRIGRFWIGRWPPQERPGGGYDIPRFIRRRNSARAAANVASADAGQDRTPAEREADQRRELFRPRLVTSDGKSFFTHEVETTLLPRDVDRAFQTGRAEYTTFLLEPEKEPVRVFTQPLRDEKHGGRITAVVQAASSLSGVYDEIDRLTKTLLALAPIALLAAGLGAALLTDRALQPVRAATRAAAKIQAQSLSARLDVAGTDEFSELARTFNGMLGRLESAFAELEAANEEQRRFVADASHELRTPLTVIKANTSLTLSEPDLTPEYREVLSEVDRAADRTIRIVQDLFLLARSDSGQLILQREPVPVLSLLEQIRQESERTSQPDAASIMVRVADVDRAMTVFGDRHHLLRLLGNLADNALRHTPPTGTVTLSAYPAPGAPSSSIVLEVADTGVGIAPEHLPHLGERFYRVDKARARVGGGTGLGLSISRTIAEAHDGSLALESAPGQGTTVRITLPRRALVPAPEASPPEAM